MSKTTTVIGASPRAWAPTALDLERLARAAEALTTPHLELWRYGASIAFEGLLAAAELVGNQRFEGYVHGALKGWAARSEPFVEQDNTAPGHAMCLLVERTPDEAVREGARRLADYLTRRRTVEGAFLSYERAPLREPYGETKLAKDERALLADPGGGVFLNMLHFGAAFFAHAGALWRDPSLVDLAVDQTLAHLRLLQDEQSGLLHHFWLERTRRAYGLGWGRGQAWALLGLFDTLEYVPRSHSGYDSVREAATRIARALGDTQHEDGSWSMVVNLPDAIREPSTAAFAAAAFSRGVETGVLSDEYAERALRAWRSAWANVDENGVLTGVSVNVGACTAIAHYANTPTGSRVMWGQGPLLVGAFYLSQLPAEEQGQ